MLLMMNNAVKQSHELLIQPPDSARPDESNTLDFVLIHWTELHLNPEAQVILESNPELFHFWDSGKLRNTNKILSI